MLKHPHLTKNRLQRFASDLRQLLYPENVSLSKLQVYSAPGRISYAEAIKAKYRLAKEGEVFGPYWSTHWFRVDYAVPAAWKGREVLLYFNSTSEGCVWRNGVPLQGLTSYNWGPEDVRSHFILLPKAKGGEKGTLYVEAAINGMFGVTTSNGQSLPPSHSIGHLRQVRLVWRDRAVWDLLWDFLTIKEMSDHLPANSLHQGPALTVANDITNAVTLADPSTYAAGREIARKFFAGRNGSYNHHLSAIGHAHIDTAWLWPLAETKRKCYRTFSTAVRIMDDYPEYKFVCSQAQQLDWIKKFQPVLYAKIKAKAKKGQFIVAGGTWIEPDCNIPSGESLVRQFLIGQRFFRKEFGAYCKEFWNPDVFGYSGALPQIMQGSGIRFFLTQKLSWNQFNLPTSNTFLWEGIDGSRVLTHFPPADTYNASCTVEDVLRHITLFKDKDRASEGYYLFGHGDGGGGPTEEMLERLRRLSDVQGMPEVAIRTPQEFFKRCEKDLADPLVWSGELYFEHHRGTYTTQAANKRDNRRCEELLHDVEFLFAVARATTHSSYPRDRINSLWETVLLNQFHDIIPGSSITEVYQDSARDYAMVLEETGKLHSAALKKVIPASSGKSVSRCAAVNTLSWERREVVEQPGGGLIFAEAPAYGFSIFDPIKTKPQNPASLHQTQSGFTLENGLVRARFDGEGHLLSFFDLRHNRETIVDGARGNQFVLFEDKPPNSDAWDVEVYHLEKRRNVGRVKSVQVVKNDLLRAGIRLKIEISPKCHLVQDISLDADSPRLDFACEVEWQEKDQFLKVEFPLALRCDHATYEIQFGHVRRPTHFNTTWDVARFEVNAFRWADLSEPSFGVALLNDSKYGYACHGNVLRLSLLRSPKAPDPVADMGRHHFRYALLPHASGPQEGGVIPAAAAFNQPLEILPSGAAPQQQSFFSVDNPAVVIDTVKKAEDSDDIILRLYESHGGHQKVTLTTSLPLKKWRIVDLLEGNAAPEVSAKSGSLQLNLRPFDLVSLRLTCG